MTPQRRKTKLIKASDSPRHYGEFSGDIAVYFRRHFDIRSPFNYHTHLKKKVSSGANKQQGGGMEVAGLADWTKFIHIFSEKLSFDRLIIVR